MESEASEISNISNNSNNSNISDSSDSSDESVSGSYSSDGEILSSILNLSDSSSDDQENPHLIDAGLQVPEGEISLEEEQEMTEVVSAPAENSSYFQICPSNVRNYLMQVKPDVVSRLKELPGRECSVVIASRNLRTQLDNTEKDRPTPLRVLWDVCVISPTDPLVVLTFISDLGKMSKATKHNSRLTRTLLQALNSQNKYSYSAVYGLVSERLCESSELFLTRFTQLENEAKLTSFSNALQMTREKCQLLVKSFLKLAAPEKHGVLNLSTELEEDR